MSIRFCKGEQCLIKKNCYRHNSMPDRPKRWRNGQPVGCREFLPFVPVHQIIPIQPTK